jgi:hypothetical protein
MGQSMLVAVLLAGAGLLAVATDAAAQQASQTPRPYAPPLVGTEPPPEPAPVYGATYIPGVGFRYLAPGGPRVYGWTYGYRAPVYGYYRARGYRRACDRDWWGFDRCRRRWH